MKSVLLLAALLAAASAEEVQITWAIPAIHKPYNTLFLNVGDSVVFAWMGLHGVYQLANGSNVGCPTSFSNSSPADLAPVANGGQYTLQLTSPGIYNYACQVGDHCVDGMLIEIVVGSGPALAPGAIAPEAPSTAPASESEGSDGR